jgi:hypothetical protein
MRIQFNSKESHSFLARSLEKALLRLTPSSGWRAFVEAAQALRVSHQS